MREYSGGARTRIAKQFLQVSSPELTFFKEKIGESLMGEMEKRIKGVMLTFASVGIIAIILLFLVYMLPTERMLSNARKSIPLFEKLGVSQPVVWGYEATTLDTYTDMWMMRIAFYSGDESVLQKCMNNYYYGYTDGQAENAGGGMIAYLNGLDGYQRLSYARYWHGYLVVLKPLLYLFDYGDIIEMLKLMQLTLVALCIALLERAKLARCIPAMIAMLGCVEFHVIGMSMQFSWVFMIAIISSIYFLRINEEKIYSSCVDLAFLVTGMCTSFFDFLTYPVFTLGIPLTIVILRRSVGNQKGRLFFFTLIDSLYWLFGYAGMWALKWILCTVFTGENIIMDGINSILERSGGDVMGTKVGFLEVISENVWRLEKYPYALIVICTIIFLLLGRGHFTKAPKEMAASYLFVICIPFFWYAVSRNHSYIHAYFAYRELGISIFAGLCFLVQVKKADPKEI